MAQECKTCHKKFIGEDCFAMFCSEDCYERDVVKSYRQGQKDLVNEMKAIIQR